MPEAQPGPPADGVQIWPHWGSKGWLGVLTHDRNTTCVGAVTYRKAQLIAFLRPSAADA